MQRNDNSSVTALMSRLKAVQAQGVTYKQIESETHISRSAISQLANQGTPMHASKMDKLTAWLNVYEENAAAQTTVEELVETANNANACEPANPEIEQGEYKTEVGIYPTEDYKTLIGFIHKLYAKRRIGALIGSPRTGKTTALRGYCENNPDAHYIECWASMSESDMLDLMAEAIGLKLTGKPFLRERQIIAALKGRTDVMYLFDEAEYLEKKNGSIIKLEALRKIWDNTGTPIVLCGTQELRRVLTQGANAGNRAQLYGRMWSPVETRGMEVGEAMQMLKSYNIATDAARELAMVAADKKHGGLGIYAEVLSIALDAADGVQIDLQMVRDAMRYKMRYA